MRQAKQPIVHGSRLFDLQSLMISQCLHPHLFAALFGVSLFVHASGESPDLGDLGRWPTEDVGFIEH